MKALLWTGTGLVALLWTLVVAVVASLANWLVARSGMGVAVDGPSAAGAHQGHGGLGHGRAGNRDTLADARAGLGGSAAVGGLGYRHASFGGACGRWSPAGGQTPTAMTA